MWLYYIVNYLKNLLATVRNYNSNSSFQKIFKGIALNKYTKLDIKSMKTKAIPYKSCKGEEARGK